MTDKNVNAINKIIAELSKRDYKAACTRFYKTHKRFDKKGNPIRLTSYSFSAETMEAIRIKHYYLDGKITEDIYKSFCLRYNLKNM